jgi:hypothetical protein
MDVQEKIRELFESEKRWWQVSLSVILLSGLGLVVWLIRAHEMEFIYSLF